MKHISNIGEIMQDKNTQNKITELEEKIKELENRLPAHSIPVAMMQELEDLEEELEAINF